MYLRSQNRFNGTPMNQQIKKKRGFALIATILLMVLLAIITVGTLSLSVVTLRSGSQGAAYARAQANARMALLIAIGELQRHTGSDTRVTASASIVDENYPQVLGVWRSWEGRDHDSSGRPISPVYNFKDQNESSGGRFIDWLVSSAATKTTPNINDPPSLVQTSARTDTIPLLAGGSLQATDKRQIHIIPTNVDENGDKVDDGRFAWWISGENQKALLAQPYEPRNKDVSALAEMGQSHSITDPTVFGLPSLITDPEPYNPSTAAAKPGSKAVSRQTMELIETGNAAEPQNKFHDLSTYSIGLLTNTATGGWRKDLSILTEKWGYKDGKIESNGIYSKFSGKKLPLFRISPDAGDTSQVPLPTLTDYTPDQSTLYPWSRHSLFSPQKWPNTWHAASSSWQSLVNFATSYKNFTYSNGVAQSPFVWNPVMKWRWQGNPNDATSGDFYDYNNTPRIHPVIARFQFIIYARAYPDPIRPGRYGLEMIWSPVVTLWNPYNVRVSIDNPGPAGGFGLTIGSNRSFPGAFAAEPLAWFPGGPDTIPLNRYRMLNAGNLQYMDTNGNFGGTGNHDNTIPENIAKGYRMSNVTTVDRWKDLRTWGLNFPTGEFALEPGEVRMFSPNNQSSGAFAGSAFFATSNGYPVGAPSGIPVTIRGGNESPNNFYWFSFKSDVETKPFRYRSAGRGFHIAFGYSDGATYQGAALYTGTSKETMSMTALTNANRAKIYWPDEDLEPHGYSVAEIASVPAMPLYSMTIGPRFTIGTGVGTSQSRPTKGFLQSDPLAGMSLVDPGVYNSNSHPANGNFEMSYNTLSFGSSTTPNLSNREGFIVTGFQSGDGLSRFITH